MASAPDDEKKSLSIHLVIAIVVAILIFLNILIGIAYLLIPKDCIRCRGPAARYQSSAASDGHLHHRGHCPRHGYEMRSIYFSGSEGRQVTIINGIVEVDDDFDAWAYWATDSEETLRGVPLNARHQYNENEVLVVGMTAPDPALGIAERYAEDEGRGWYRAENSPDGIVAGSPGSGELGAGLAGYDSEPRMDFARERMIARARLARSVDGPPPPQSPPTVRTWGRDSDATIRAVVESPRREMVGSKNESCGMRV
ncbi:hypothetical protein V8C37DRAFT_155569 [Trichoderma ceciliae]